MEATYSGLTNYQISNPTLVVKYHGKKHLPEAFRFKVLHTSAQTQN